MLILLIKENGVKEFALFHAVLASAFMGLAVFGFPGCVLSGHDLFGEWGGAEAESVLD
ncbi:MAG: hypothetical protein JWN98_521, partial [Abditibacteriota bacterium]|nr:hypothetical protein [Abditibacteriota bacterium]